MTTPSPGNAIVAPYRALDIWEHAPTVLNGIAAAIDAHITKLQANLDSAIEGQRISLERALAAEQLAADRLEGLLAGAAFSSVLVKQLRLEHDIAR